MSLECALKILREKGLINIEVPLESKRSLNTPRRCPYYTVSSKKTDLIDKICEEIYDRTDCICSDVRTKYNEENYDYFHFVETKKVDEWLENNCKEEETEIIKCKDFIRDYIEDHTDYYQGYDCNGYLIINKKVRDNRIKKEKDEEEKAIELFESML